MVDPQYLPSGWITSRDPGSETRIPARGQMVMPIMSGVEHHDLGLVQVRKERNK